MLESLILDSKNFQNDSKICEAEVTLTPLINKICKPCDCDSDITCFASLCHGNTRQWLFEDFDKWFSDPGYSRAYVLLGDAGVGKSVIAGALAQRKRDSEHLAAPFFCRHKDRRRNYPLSLLATLARDLCKCSSEYSSIVGGEEGVRKLITNSEFSLEVHELFAKLLEEPLAKCRSPPNRRLVIIDALDETVKIFLM